MIEVTRQCEFSTAGERKGYIGTSIELNSLYWVAVIPFSPDRVHVGTGATSNAAIQAATRDLEAYYKKEEEMERTDMHFGLLDIEERYDQLKEDYRALEDETEQQIADACEDAYEEGKRDGYDEGRADAEYIGESMYSEGYEAG
jgi:hypothetical protein